MTNTTNKIKKKLGRKQMRLSDLYRYMAVGIVVNISGIADYHVTRTCINVQFIKDNGLVKTYHATTELERKDVIKQINKILSEV